MRSRIWAWMVTSSAVVGSSAISSSGSQASAMAIMTRWAMPPDSACGKALQPPLGIGDADHPQQLGRARSRGALLLHPPMDLEDLADLPADVVDRVQAARRLLEDHADPRRRAARAAPPERGSAGPRPSNMTSPRLDPAGRRDQAHDATGW